MLVLDHQAFKKYIEDSGMKQKAISEKTGVPETALCLILQGKRKCEIGEYANICTVLNVPMGKFLKPRLSDGEEVKGERAV